MTVSTLASLWQSAMQQSLQEGCQHEGPILEGGLMHRGDQASDTPEHPAADDVAPMQGPHSSADTGVCVSVVDAQLVCLVSHQQQQVGTALGKVGQGGGKGEGGGAGS